MLACWLMATACDGSRVTFLPVIQLASQQTHLLILMGRRRGKVEGGAEESAADHLKPPWVHPDHGLGSDERDVGKGGLVKQNEATS